MESSIKKQSITVFRVFTENNQVYMKKGKYERLHVPLRWIPVVIPEQTSPWTQPPVGLHIVGMQAGTERKIDT